MGAERHTPPHVQNHVLSRLLCSTRPCVVPSTRARFDGNTDVSRLTPDQILSLQRSIGNQAVQRLIASAPSASPIPNPTTAPIQRSTLKVGRADDRYEQEADAIATTVVQGTSTPSIQRKTLPSKVVQRAVDASSIYEAVEWTSGARKNFKLRDRWNNQLNLKSDAKAIASNLAKLKKTLDVNVYTKLEKEFFEIAGRIHEAGQSGDLEKTTLDARRLEVLMRQTSLMVKGNDKNQKKSDRSLQKLGEFLLSQVRSTGNPDMSPEELGKALADHLMANSDNRSQNEISMDVRAINHLARNAPPDSVEQQAAVVAAARLTKLNQQKMAALGPSKAERGEAGRTPSEVMVNFVSIIDAKAKQAKGSDPVLNTVLEQAKLLILKHMLQVGHVVSFLKKAADYLSRNGHKELSRLCDDLSGQLPINDSDIAPTRLQDNLYGRVFDSGFVSDLVKTPPPGVMSAMEQSAKALAAWLTGGTVPVDVRKKVATDLQHKFKDEDPRFWFPQVPEMQNFIAAGSPDDALAALLRLLNSTIDTGVKAQAVPYVLVKLSLVLREAGKAKSVALPGMPTDAPPEGTSFEQHLRNWQRHKKNVEYGYSPWMEAANENYASVVSKQTGRTDAPDTDLGGDGKWKAHVPKTMGSGLTLLHQPNPFVENWMTPSVRPTTKNMPNIKPGSNGKTGYPTESVETALSHGLAYGSGVSGSTNIMLHIFDHLKKGAVPGLDVKDFLLGTMMFLVYDGGHSMHEVLWTANQLDKKLGLGLNIGDSDNPTKFVSDYDKFMELYDSSDQDSTGTHVARAAAAAFENVIDYFNQYSYYSPNNQKDGSS